MDVLNRLINDFHIDHIEKPVKEHLKNVYATMTVGLLVSALGAYLQVAMDFKMYGLVTVLVELGCMVALLCMQPTPQNEKIRLGLFQVVAFLSGINLGPLISLSIRINPQLIAQAFLGTSAIFGSFTAASLLSQSRKFLALGGVLGSLMMVSTGMMLGSWLTGSAMLIQMNLYLTFGVVCLFVLYDTQLIVEKARMGDSDYIGHSMTMFLDFINIFRLLLTILMSREDNRRNRRND